MQIDNGCVKFIITDNDLMLKSKFTLNIVATVTELQTNRVESDVGKIGITNRPFEFSFSEDYLYFQPGLPYNGKLNIFNRFIKENNQIIEICYHIAIKNKWNLKRKTYCKNFTLDDKDYVHFSIHPFKNNVYQLHLKVKIR